MLGSNPVTYKDQPWYKRFEVMGQTAEAAFNVWAGPRIIQRLGYDNSPLPRGAMLQLPPFARHIPDYILWDEGLVSFVEVVGTARREFKVRSSKLYGLETWRNSGVPLDFFVFNSTADEYAFVSYEQALVRRGPQEHFYDGNVFHRVPVDSWTALPR